MKQKLPNMDEETWKWEMNVTMKFQVTKGLQKN